MIDEEICVYCNSYWRVGHTANCPSSTGIYPIADFREESIRCPECEELIKDFYTIEDDVVICIGCAALIKLLQ